MPIAVPVAPPLAAHVVLKPKVELTAGQCEPVDSLIQPYAAFPKDVTGPTLWTKEELYADESRWKYRWTPELVAELEASYAEWVRLGQTLPQISKVSGFRGRRHQLIHSGHVQAIRKRRQVPDDRPQRRGRRHRTGPYQGSSGDRVAH